MKSRTGDPAAVAERRAVAQESRLLSEKGQGAPCGFGLMKAGIAQICRHARRDTRTVDDPVPALAGAGAARRMAGWPPNLVLAEHVPARTALRISSHGELCATARHEANWVALARGLGLGFHVDITSDGLPLAA